MNWDMLCPVCKEDLIIPVGPRISPILIIGDAPGQQEIKEGKPFVGGTGGVLRDELAFLHIDMKKLRITNLWLHAENKNKECLEYGAKKAIEEAINRRVILLIGSDTVKYFCNESVEEWNGLIVPCNYFTGSKVMACVQPATAFHGGTGEIRFALSRFAELLREEKLV